MTFTAYCDLALDRLYERDLTTPSNEAVDLRFLMADFEERVPANWPWEAATWIVEEGYGHDFRGMGGSAQTLLKPAGRRYVEIARETAASAAPTQPKVKAYLDTVLVSSIVKRDLSADEQKALSALLRARSTGKLVAVTSGVTMEEIARLPPDVRSGHEDILHLIEMVEAAPEARTDSGLTMMGVGGGMREDPVLTSLKETLPDESDARHLFQAIRCDATHFVTADKRTILRHRESLGGLGLEIVLPSEVLARLNAAD